MTQPNIILLMSDQQRWDTLGCNGNVFISTPNLDALAAGGANCVHSYTPWPVCTPARATMWTGVMPHQHRVIMNVYDMEDVLAESSAESRTVFAMLQDAGYSTAYFGKWHLGDAKPEYFDVWEGWNSMGGHWVDGVKDGVYKPDLQTDQLIEYMRDQVQSGQPFMAVNGFYPPHNPYTAPERFYESYRGKGILRAGYYAAVTALDYNVGRIVDALEELGIRENTILVYYSDHGEQFRYRDGASNKFVCHEDAIRVPFIINCPGTIEAGTVLDEFIGLEDLMPTVLEWAGLEQPDYLHGKSIVPLVTGESVVWREAYYIQNIMIRTNVAQRAIRTEKWKLILSEKPRTMRSYAGSNHLYNLENDPEEELDIYETPREDNHNQYLHYPPFTEQITELAQLLRSHAEAIGDDLGVEMANDCLLEMSKRA